MLAVSCLQDGTASGNGHRRGSLAALTHAILGRLESLACDCAVSFPPQEMLPAVQHTLDCVQVGTSPSPPLQPAPDLESATLATSLAVGGCNDPKGAVYATS